jgi:hypothetical protein
MYMYRKMFKIFGNENKSKKFNVFAKLLDKNLPLKISVPI